MATPQVVGVLQPGNEGSWPVGCDSVTGMECVFFRIGGEEEKFRKQWEED